MWDRADERRAVNSIGDRAVYDVFNANFREDGHTGKRALQHIGDPVQIIGEKRVHEMRVDAIHAPCATVLLVKPDQQPVLFLPTLVITDRAAQKWHSVPCIANGWDVFGNEILMLH